MVGRRQYRLGRHYQRQYEETGDRLFLLLAIGCSSDDPPQWALDECRKLESEFDLSTRPFERESRVLDSNPMVDGLLLDQMANLYVEGYSVRAAAVAVTGELDDGRNHRRLRRIWKSESKPLGYLDGDRKKKLDTNKWVERALDRGKFMQLDRLPGPVPEEKLPVIRLTNIEIPCHGRED